MPAEAPAEHVVAERVATAVEAPELRLLVLQPTPFCNIDCAYCYLGNRDVAGRMPLDVLRAACRLVFGSALFGPRLDIAWHAGEPLTVPLDWYEAALRIIEEERPPGLRLRHSFQTNGLLLTPDWVRFLRRTGATVGLSIDGPADLHDANRRTRSGQGTHAAAMRAVRLLQAEGFPFHVITVLTAAALDRPNELFEFYLRNGIREIGFNIEEIEGANRRSSLAAPGVEARFRLFLRRFLRLVAAPSTPLRVREFEEAVAHLLEPGPVRDEQNLPFAIVSVGHDGSVSTFSPELLGARHLRFQGFAFGHVATGDLGAMAQAPSFRAVQEEIQRGVEVCRRDCAYFRWCGGGAPANKLFETGRFDTAETLHCRLSRQAVFDEVIAALEAQGCRAA